MLISGASVSYTAGRDMWSKNKSHIFPIITEHRSALINDQSDIVFEYLDIIE